MPTTPRRLAPLTVIPPVDPERTAQLMRPRDPVQRPKPLRERPSRFTVPPSPRDATTPRSRDLGPSMALRASTLGPLTSEYRENELHITGAQRQALVQAQHATAKQLKERGLGTDVFFVEASEAREAAFAARAAAKAASLAASEQTARARREAALAAHMAAHSGAKRSAAAWT